MVPSLLFVRCVIVFAEAVATMKREVVISTEQCLLACLFVGKGCPRITRKMSCVFFSFLKKKIIVEKLIMSLLTTLLLAGSEWKQFSHDVDKTRPDRGNLEIRARSIAEFNQKNLKHKKPTKRRSIVRSTLRSLKRNSAVFFLAV